MSATPSNTFNVDEMSAAAMTALLAESWWVIALRGVAAILFGVLALWVPVAAMLALAIYFAAYVFVDGVLALIAAVRAARAHQRWGLLAFTGVLNIAMGIIAALFPVAAILAFVLVNAVWALLAGGALVGTAFRIHEGRWWLAASGVVSIIWGVLLLISPLIGALVLTWWLGAYCLVFGCLLLVLAFKLHDHRDSLRSMTGNPAAQGSAF